MKKKRIKSFIFLYNGDVNKARIIKSGCTYSNIIEMFGFLMRHLNSGACDGKNIQFIEVYYSNDDGKGLHYLGLCSRRSMDFNLEGAYEDFMV